MKKTIISAVLLIATLASTFTSCQTLQQLSQDPTLQQIGQQLLAQAISNAMTGTPTGTTYNYSGTLTSVVLKKGADGQYNYLNGTGKTTAATAACPLIISTAGGTSYGNITLPATVSVDGVTMSGAAFGNLSIGTAKSGNTLALSENTTGAGTLTVGAQTYQLSSVFIDCTYNTASTMKYSMSIYFGDNLDYAVNVTFDGKVAQ